MADVVNPQVMDALTSDNVKTIGESGSFYTALAFQNAVQNQQIANLNAVTHQQAINTILAAAVGTIVKVLTEVDPTQAMSEQVLLTGNRVAEMVANLNAGIAAIQQLLKGAQTTPPQTGAGG